MLQLDLSLRRIFLSSVTTIPELETALTIKLVVGPSSGNNIASLNLMKANHSLELHTKLTS